MFRTVFGRAAAGAAAAGAAGAAAATTGQAHAHARPIRLYPGGSVVDERLIGGPPRKIEEDWIVPQLQGEDILFTPEEIEQTVEDITGIAVGGARVYTPSDADSNETEAIDNDANEIIDQANIVPAGEGMQRLAKMTTIMLNRPSIQREILQAFQQEPELREMIDSFSSVQGRELGSLTFGQKPELLGSAPKIEDITDGEPVSFLAALLHDIGCHLEAAGEKLLMAGQHVGNFLGRIGRWLRNSIGFGQAKEGESGAGSGWGGSGVVSMTICFAAVVMAVLLAKRMGVIRILVRH